MLEFITFATICATVAYPFWGAILYGDPWLWIFRDI